MQKRIQSAGNCKTFCHARMLLSGIHDFRQFLSGFPPRSVAGMTESGVLGLIMGHNTNFLQVNVIHCYDVTRIPESIL